VIILVCRQIELAEDAVNVFFDGVLRDRQTPCDGGIGQTLGHQRDHFALAGAENRKLVVTPACEDQVADEGRVEMAAALATRCRVSMKSSTLVTRVLSR
jgi:hypothetical protein